MIFGLLWMLLPLTGVAGPATPATHLELEISDTNGMAMFWSIKIAPSGEVTRDGDSPLGPQRLSVAARDRLKTLLSREQFFALNRAYGIPVVEGRWRMISATLDGRRHAVLLYDLPTEGKSEAGVQAALRVWYGALQEATDGVRVEKNDSRILAGRRR